MNRKINKKGVTVIKRPVFWILLAFVLGEVIAVFDLNIAVPCIVPAIIVIRKIIIKAYDEFEDRIQYLITRKISKPDRIKAIISQTLGKISKKDLMERCPDISQGTIERTLSNLVKEGYIIKVGSGPATAYIRKH